MKKAKIILAIETSCDETSVAVVKSSQDNHQILSNIVSSQIKIHAPYGGVVPNLAKREHQKNLVPVLKLALLKAGFLDSGNFKIPGYLEKEIENVLSREEVLWKKLKRFLKKYSPPKVDFLAVTVGPGLAPALWPGINLTKALSLVWQKPVIGVNHLQGHIYANWLGSGIQDSGLRYQERFPAVCLIVSGGHTQLVLMKSHWQYQLLGETRDDAAGEAFDKVAKLLGLGYPGGPIIAKEAEKYFQQKKPRIKVKLPRPMIYSKDFDFSFSGLKTAVLYLVNDLKKRYSLNQIRPVIAAEFQQAVIDVLIKKTLKAVSRYHPKTVIFSGGVIANQELRKQMKLALKKNFPTLPFLFPSLSFCTDNAAMIAVAAFYQILKKKPISCLENLQAQANLSW